jgi:hypothetical protein
MTSSLAATSREPTKRKYSTQGALSVERTEPIRNIVHRAPITTGQFVEDHKGVFS